MPFSIVHFRFRANRRLPAVSFRCRPRNAPDIPACRLRTCQLLPVSDPRSCQPLSFSTAGPVSRLSLSAPGTLQTSLPAASGPANSSRFPTPGPVSLFRFRPPDLSNCRSGDVKSAKPTCFEAPDLCRTACRNLAESVRFTIQKCAGSCRLSHCSGPNAGPDLANIEKSCKLCNISGGKSEEDFRPKNHTYRHFTPPCAPCGRDARRVRGARPARDADDAPARHILRAWAAGPYAKA